VLIVGHLSEVKGYPTFLRAAAAIASVVRDCAFLALGGETTSPGYGAYLQQLARDLGIGDRVHFLGWQKNVAEVMRAADVMVLPSVVEGLPMAVLEAMSCGRPVVASAVNGTPEAVLHEITGLLIPPNEPAALAAAVVRLLGAPHLARRMGNAGRIRVEEHFSLDKAAAAIQRLYTELLDGGPFTAEKHVRHMTADVDAGLNARVITRELRDSA
jgi:glycosyltransferase involved in cell wall biosynthesis